ESWTGNKQKEHNTYTKSLGTIIATGSSEQQLTAPSALNGFTRGVESDRNAKEYETVLKNLDMAFTVEHTLEHNDYVNEVGQQRRQAMKHASEHNQEEESIDSNKSNKSNYYSLRKK
ncbi:16606_t:CDS:2, partial [Cetraspora pellucida]